tara:strand:+ start:87293 stop:87937 length:645 start_codon:yes stop_codon:yes gene_type:complete
MIIIDCNHCSTNRLLGFEGITSPNRLSIGYFDINLKNSRFSIKEWIAIMKKLITLGLILILVGCGSTKDFNGIAGKKALKGEWQVDQLEFFGAEGTYKAFMFDMADSYCFKNSTWMFIPNNYTGKFTLASNSSDCESTTARIRWSFFDTDTQRYIQFKYTDDKNKSLDPMNGGYRMKVKSLSQENMKLELEVAHQGKPFTVEMSMSKISDNVVL